MALVALSTPAPPVQKRDTRTPKERFQDRAAARCVEASKSPLLLLMLDPPARKNGLIMNNESPEVSRWLVDAEAYARSMVEIGLPIHTTDLFQSCGEPDTSRSPNGRRTLARSIMLQLESEALVFRQGVDTWFVPTRKSDGIDYFLTNNASIQSQGITDIEVIE